MRHLLLALVLSHLGGLALLSRHTRSGLTRLCMRGVRDDAIDPLDGLRAQRPPKTPSYDRRGRIGRLERRREDLQSADGVPIAPRENLTQVSELLEAKLVELETKRAESLSPEVLVEFQSMMQRGVPQLALFILVEHVALLIPALFQLKQYFDVSIMPFLYIGPALYMLPYIVFFLWEFDITPMPFIDQKLFNFVRYLKRKGKEQVSKENEVLDPIKTSKLEEANLGVLMNIAFYRALSKIDCDKVYGESIAIRRHELQCAKKGIPSGRGGLGVITIDKKDGTIKAGP